jgi:hypothetical protein
LCLVTSWFEIAIPDVHDGDVATLQVAASESLGTPYAAHATDDGSTSSSRHELPTDGPHQIHIDHCGHSHVVATPRQVILPRDVMVSIGRAAWPPTELFASISLAPRLRPPIA